MMIKFKYIFFTLVSLLIAGALVLIAWDYITPWAQKPWVPALTDPGKDVLSGNEYRLTWTFSGSGLPGTNYMLQRATDPNYTKDVTDYGPLTGRSLGITAPSLSQNTTFFYRIRAGYKIRWFQAYVWLGWSNTVDITVKHIPPSTLSSKNNITKNKIKALPPAPSPKKDITENKIKVAPPIGSTKENTTPPPVEKHPALTNPPSPALQEVTGHWIAQKVFDRDHGKNSLSESTMVLVTKNDDKKTRLFTHRRRFENGLENQLIRFTSPADIEGTGFLIIEHPGYETEQSLYLPALRRSRRIATSQKSHRFVNSDFSYEDMERQSVDKYLYEIKGEKIFAGLECYDLETRPKKDTISQYSSTRTLVAKTSFVPLFVRFFDKKGDHIKTYEVAKLELIQNIWTESVVIMKDLTNDHTTYIKINHITYNTDVSADQISKSALENY